jgi:hypothetical protein
VLRRLEYENVLQDATKSAGQAAERFGAGHAQGTLKW